MSDEIRRKYWKALECIYQKRINGSDVCAKEGTMAVLKECKPLYQACSQAIRVDAFKDAPFFKTEDLA